MGPIAEVRFACGRSYLSVAEIAVAMEGDKCRESSFPEDVLPPIPQEELSRASVGGTPCAEMDIKLVRFFRGDNWTESMMEYTAKRINEAAQTSDWRPIETAPKDGAKFLAYTYDFGYGVAFNHRVQEARWTGKTQDDRMGHFEAINGQMITHWMPLPKPPTPA